VEREEVPPEMARPLFPPGVIEMVRCRSPFIDNLPSSDDNGTLTALTESGGHLILPKREVK
jgi:hypothetical protein